MKAKKRGENMKKGVWIGIGVVVAILAIFFISSYNGLVSKETTVDEKWAQVDNQLKRRADLIPNLVNSVKGLTSHEKDIVDSVTKARAQMAGNGTPNEKLKADQELSSALSRLMVVVENYPNIKSDTGFKTIMDNLEGTENRLAVARKDYINSVADFNKKLKTFPTNMVGGMFGFEKKDQFKADEKDKEAPKVDFGGNK